MSLYKLRKGEKKDCNAIMLLIMELASYEKASDEVTNTVEQLQADGFGENPLYECLVAEVDNKVVGLALWYYRYSTWKGKRLYLEDIIVTKEQRGKGIGKALFDLTITSARERNCTGMTWQVLDWNEPALNFYKKYDTHFDDEWDTCNLNF